MGEILCIGVESLCVHGRRDTSGPRTYDVGDAHDPDRERGEDRPVGQDLFGRASRLGTVRCEDHPLQGGTSRYKDGTMRVIDDLVRHRTKQERGDRAVASRADDDQIRRKLASLVDERARGSIPGQHCVHDTVGC